MYRMSRGWAPIGVLGTKAESRRCEVSGRKRQTAARAGSWW